MPLVLADPSAIFALAGGMLGKQTQAPIAQAHPSRKKRHTLQRRFTNQQFAPDQGGLLDHG